MRRWLLQHALFLLLLCRACARAQSNFGGDEVYLAQSSYGRALPRSSPMMQSATKIKSAIPAADLDRLEDDFVDLLDDDLRAAEGAAWDTTAPDFDFWLQYFSPVWWCILGIELAVLAAVANILPRVANFLWTLWHSRSQSGTPTESRKNALCGDALLEAISQGDLPRCQELLGFSLTPVDDEDMWGVTALHTAVHCGHAEIARLLIARGANVRARDSWEETPLHFAARMGDVEMCDILLRSGADINALNSGDQNPLLVAAAAGMEGACKFLLHHGSVVGVSDKSLCPLLYGLLVARMVQPEDPGFEPLAN